MTITLINRGKHSLTHDEYNLLPQQTIAVPDNIAETWLKIDGIEKYVDPTEAKAKEAKAAEKQKALEDENAKLKAEIEKLKAEAAKEDGAEKSLEELKKEADALGIEYAKTIGVKALQAKIEAKKGE